MIQTVLLVDDEPYIREGLRSFIDWETEGFQVIGEAEDGQSAFARIRDEKPDVVLCDIRMPHLDGLALIEKVQAELEYSPVVIILSGYDDFSYAQRALRLGVSNYLLKPVQRDELLAELRHIRTQVAQLRTATEPEVVIAPALDLILRSPSPQRLSEALGITISSAVSAQTAAYMFVVTDYGLIDDVKTLMDEIEQWFICEGLSLSRRTHSTVLECIEIRGHSFKGATLRELEGSIEQRATSLGVSLRVFRGPIVRGVGHAPESFAGLDTAIRTAFYVTEIFTYREVPVREHGYDPQPLERILALCESVSSLRETAFRQEVDEIHSSLMANPVQPEAVLAAANSLLVDVWKLVAEREGSVEDLETATGGTPSLTASLGIHGVLSRLRSYGQTAITYLKSIHSDTRNQTVRDVKLYVTRHLTDRLQVKDIAKQLGLHPYYLGRLFKEQTGQTLTEHVHVVRVEAAKEMLIRRDSTLSDIALWVGYSDSEYFSRKFKEIVGESPRSFRERSR